MNDQQAELDAARDFDNECGVVTDEWEDGLSAHENRLTNKEMRIGLYAEQAEANEKRIARKESPIPFDYLEDDLKLDRNCAIFLAGVEYNHENDTWDGSKIKQKRS